MKILSNKNLEELKVGDYVKVKSFEEIKKTLDKYNKYSSICFINAMIPYCNRIWMITGKSKMGFYLNNDWHFVFIWLEE